MGWEFTLYGEVGVGRMVLVGFLDFGRSGRIVKMAFGT